MVQHIHCDLYHKREAFQVPIHTKRAKYLFWVEKRLRNVSWRYMSNSINILVIPKVKDYNKSAAMKWDWTLTSEMHMAPLILTADKDTCLTETTHPVSGYIKKKKISNTQPLNNSVTRYYMPEKKNILLLHRGIRLCSHPFSRNDFKFWLNLVLMKYCVNPCPTSRPMFPPLAWQGGDNVVTGRRWQPHLSVNGANHQCKLQSGGHISYLTGR